MKRFQRCVLVLWAVVLMLLAGAIMAQRGQRRNGNHGPKMVVMPVQVQSDFPQVRQEMEYITFQALKQIDFTIITGKKVERACKKRGFSLQNYSKSDSQDRGRVLSDYGRNSKPVVSQSVLYKDALMEVGDYFKARYALGILYEMSNKTTRYFPGGRRENGRCKVKITVVDVRSGEIVYSIEKSPEFGATIENQNAGTAVSIAGVLAATGVIGSGNKTRTLGWIGVLSPQVAKFDKGSKEDLQLQAGIEGAKTVFNDFNDRYQARSR